MAIIGPIRDGFPPNMTKNSLTLLSFLVTVAVALVFAGHVLPNPWLVYISKPLATILILTIPFANWRRHKDSYSLWITIGLLFSFIGDIALLWPSLYFLPGLFAFLLAHAAYLIAFTRDARFPARFPVWLLYLGIASALFVFLLPKLPAGLPLPVALYAVVLASMAGQSMGRFLVHRSPAARLAAIGAIFFMLSDSLLSVDRFRSPLPFAPFLILCAYYIAQWLIASSTRPTGSI